MNRRGFLRALATGAAVGVVAPAALVELLTPKRTIFLPPRGGWFVPADVYELQTAIGAELDALLKSHAPIYYDDAGLEMIEARVHAVIRKFGETDAQLRERMMLTISQPRGNIELGMYVTGPGIPPGTRIVRRA